ncbi:COX15/CtaA family protein [Shewanella zhangzhouensis]|uniref:COX15/CtaA family protein n=1 Tax=Shewanella zhangzhouensis TaxID=2864213 RepID=UPI001C65A967|nr:COX15/CtaA family protein [Shewanella zhangzhouensis]QYK05114.1 COX15/CtaA family protein [Shewanella zhangzhouensis]
MTLRNLLKLTLACTLMVILLGAYTRLSDAGLGCPDWPGCYGHFKVPSAAHELAKAESLFPDHTIDPTKAWPEMIHRYIASSLGLLVILVLIACYRLKEAPRKLPIFILLLILFQGALGAWTVTMKLMPVVVMSHLLGGFTLLSLLTLLYLRTSGFRIPGGDPGMRQYQRLALACVGVLVAQILLGGWTSSNYAALACTELPFCEGDWTTNLKIADAFSPFQGTHPSFEFGVLDYHARMTIHIAHRFGAMITAALLGLLAFRMISRAHSKVLRHAGWVLAGFLVLQIGLGISNVVLHLPLAIAVAHNLGAAFLLVTLVFINYALWRKA